MWKIFSVFFDTGATHMIKELCYSVKKRKVHRVLILLTSFSLFSFFFFFSVFPFYLDLARLNSTNVWPRPAELLWRAPGL